MMIPFILTFFIQITLMINQIIKLIHKWSTYYNMIN